MKTEETRVLVERFVEAQHASDVGLALELLSEDAVWQPPVGSGAGPYEGREEVANAIAGGAGGSIFKGPTTKTIHKIVVENDSAVVFLRNQGEFKRGGEYDNEYAWHYVCKDGKVTYIRHYSDTLNAVKQMGLKVTK